MRERVRGGGKRKFCTLVWRLQIQIVVSRTPLASNRNTFQYCINGPQMFLYCLYTVSTITWRPEDRQQKCIDFTAPVKSLSKDLSLAVRSLRWTGLSRKTRPIQSLAKITNLYNDTRNSCVFSELLHYKKIFFLFCLPHGNFCKEECKKKRCKTSVYVLI